MLSSAGTLIGGGEGTGGDGMAAGVTAVSGIADGMAAEVDTAGDDGDES